MTQMIHIRVIERCHYSLFRHILSISFGKILLKKFIVKRLRNLMFLIHVIFLNNEARFNIDVYHPRQKNER